MLGKPGVNIADGFEFVAAAQLAGQRPARLCNAFQKKPALARITSMPAAKNKRLYFIPRPYPICRVPARQSFSKSVLRVWSRCKTFLRARSASKGKIASARKNAKIQAAEK